MSQWPSHLVATEVRGASLLRGEVVSDEHGVFEVRFMLADEQRVVAMDLLRSDSQHIVHRGDRVLCWVEADATAGVILGVIGSHHVVAPTITSTAAEMPDELVLEAKHSLTLRVGDGSITIREDGKILIKGKDLVSHAQRMNRIKGGAVSIN